MGNNKALDECRVIQLPQIKNRAGNITPISSNLEIPFQIKRVYYLYDIPGGETRGGHAHKRLYQLMVAASGSFDVLLDNGISKRKVMLNRPNTGLIIVPGIWRELSNFSSGSVSLVLASLLYDESDYIREYKQFLKYKNEI